MNTVTYRFSKSENAVYNPFYDRWFTHIETFQLKRTVNELNDFLWLKHLSYFILFYYKSSQSTADLLTVVSDRIAMAFNRDGATRAVYILELYIHLIYPKLSTEFGMLVFFTNFGPMEFLARYLALILLFSVIGRFGWFWMGNI